MTYLVAAVLAAVSMLMTAGMAGTFFGFSVGVMPGLNAAPASSAIDAMNAVNAKIQNPVFLAAFVLAPVAAAGAGALLLTTPHSGAAWPFFAAAAVYTVGVIVATAAVNVPMNNALAAAVPGDLAEAARIWSDYSARWTTWNTGRAVAGAVSLLLMGYGAYRWGRGS
ncbi:anthrone oxygenase family protein [Microtetraspora niveoalba]|uniref:anthrone oxygenase family protein n=1 Tax=Microtetraspora niveoalba TaxID=46175 RepID=UPI000A9BD815|nr:anthrone oxygenase family protein [Microtetraspora niveoalba]